MRCGVLSMLAAGVCGSVLLVGGSAAIAQDFVRDTVPNKWIEPLVPENLPPLDLPAYVVSDPLEKAAAESFAGRYKLSLLTLHKVKKGNAADIALVRAASLGALGQKQQAIAALSVPAIAGEARVQIARARLMAEIGQTDQAIDLLRQVVKDHPDSIAAHYYWGQICEDAGKIVEARAAYEFFAPFVDKWQAGGADGFDNAADVTLLGRGLDRWASVNSQYQINPNLHQLILDIFTKAYDEIDRTYWPAHVAAAEYYLSHDDPKNAIKQLQIARAANPRDIHTLELLGEIALSQFDFDSTDQAVDAIRQIDASSVEGDFLEARNLLGQQRPQDAEFPVKQFLSRQPKNLEALGLLAAVYALQLEDDKTHQILKQVDQIDPQNATAYFEVAQQLAAMRQYPRSEAMYQAAIDRAPWWTDARNGLGLLYTQSGDEDLAKKVLQEAHTLDPFNKAATNYLRLLHDLDGFAAVQTPHFIVMYDGKQDPMIPEYYGDYLESIYPKVTAEYKTEPSGKTIIEVFPTHDEFAVRTTGSPWIGTVGASTGRVIAMDSPRRGSSPMGSYNWAQVLRHEFTHTVTLAATDNRISHWMTEGLAVNEEHTPIRWEWVPMLYHAVTQHQLFPIDSLTWSFVRPKHPIDRQLAYAESYWICKYIDQAYGHDAILKLLAEAKAGKSQDAALTDVLGKSVSSFQQEFFDWCDKQVASWGYDAATTKKYGALVKEGQHQIDLHQYQKAAETWEKIAALRPVDALPHLRLAGLYLAALNQPEKAIGHLIALDQVELSNNRYAKRLATLFEKTNHLDQAAQYAMQAVYIDPYDMDAHTLLRDIEEKTGNKAGLEREEKVIPELQKWLDVQDKDTDSGDSTDSGGAGDAAK